ncbi:hypothetical protein [Microvirga sp. Mcv34]|uniref:hypothetical protein n=1 Tax=Microvirga sp. Mcv34 TaxID=2926016 RepID=UPI0021C70D7F|nr:hypothetical protein [Microvirga sp. Mcv34]
MKRVIWLKTERGYVKSCLNDDGPAGLIWARRYKAEDPDKHPYLILGYRLRSRSTLTHTKGK